ncbi:hypothetical protein SteCoe_16957 [Stentor coeruleus]|uniref:Transmembrane protein n=1 Tax=Stentor coeruleus TaxID=5963 RepID=A0A1R2C060_9CILI|nr:hypothetical protein SteCoe_16957 [Stentor coeruleus]
MSDSEDFNMDELPLTYLECHKLRCKLVEKLTKDKNSNDYKRLRELSWSYEQQGGILGFYSCLGALALILLKFRNLKPHKPGLVLGFSVAIGLGGFSGFTRGLKNVIQDIGPLRSSEFDEDRRNILKKCTKY